VALFRFASSESSTNGDPSAVAGSNDPPADGFARSNDVSTDASTDGFAFACANDTSTDASTDGFACADRHAHHRAHHRMGELQRGELDGRGGRAGVGPRRRVHPRWPLRRGPVGEYEA